MLKWKCSQWRKNLGCEWDGVTWERWYGRWFWYVHVIIVNSVWCWRENVFNEEKG